MEKTGKEGGATVLAGEVEAAPGAPVPGERLEFKTLLLANPNYFGNLEESPFKPVKVVKGNKSFEELVCVGLCPPFDRLEAVVHVKQPNGYSGDICSDGSVEYVRFYVDLFDNGIWHDVGLASVNVHDIPGPKPLAYAVARTFAPHLKLCVNENVVRVRAILSWNAPPPPNMPGFSPVWGNVVTVQVQIRPRRKLIWEDIAGQLALEKVKIPDPIGPIVTALDPTLAIKALPAEPTSLAQKKVLYASKGVPAHRFAFPEVHALVAQGLSPGVFAANAKSPLVELGLSLAEATDVIAQLIKKTDGDTTYEELTCVGLHPKKDRLEAVVRVKKASGYSGQLCSAGSTEYVAFWADFGDGAGFAYLGTATVNVHDLKSIPDSDLHYAVSLRTDLSKYVVPCHAGPKVVRVRAILSWEAPPPPSNPNYVPVWGNREERLVQLRPGKLVGRIPLLDTVGDIVVEDIAANGLATGTGVVGHFSAFQSPFGGQITITGRLGDPPSSFNGGPPPFKYRIEVRKLDGVDTWHPIANTFSVQTTRTIGGVPQEESPGDFHFAEDQVATDDGDGLGAGWYTYLEDLTGPDQREVVQDVLAQWQTTPQMEGDWELRLDMKDPSTTPPTVYPGAQLVRIRIDNTAPTAHIALTGATLNGVDLGTAANCGRFKVGTILRGEYAVADASGFSPHRHFGGFSIEVLPTLPANGAHTVPIARSFPVVPTTGETGTFTLNTGDMSAADAPTSPMQACGYVLRLVASDRTNYDSRGIAFTAVDSVGFCLEDDADDAANTP